MPPERKNQGDDFGESEVKYMLRHLQKDCDGHTVAIEKLRDDVFGKDGLSSAVTEIKSQIKMWLAVVGVVVAILVPLLTSVLNVWVERAMK